MMVKEGVMWGLVREPVAPANGAVQRGSARLTN
jgi:hypothetical protein